MRALATVFQFEPTITCAGRTDAGVHAHGQVITVDVPDRPAALADLERLRRSLDRLSGAAIAVAAVRIVPDDFDARQNAIARTYRYVVENRPVGDPTLRSLVWHVPSALAIDRMNAAASYFVGTHDFSSFCRRKSFVDLDGTVGEATRIRTVTTSAWKRSLPDDGLLEFWITATSFCQQMVRSLVGTTVDVGLGHREVADVATMLSAGDRNAAGRVAPPQGLSLRAVIYPDPLFDQAAHVGAT